jgi:hypothetical protein
MARRKSLLSILLSPPKKSSKRRAESCADPVAQRTGIVAKQGSSTMCLRGSVRGGAPMDYPWNPNL